MTREELIRRGEAALRLLGDEVAMAALAELSAECAALWAASNPADVTAREDAYRLQRCVALLHEKLAAWAATARIEKGNAAQRLTETFGGIAAP